VAGSISANLQVDQIFIFVFIVSKFAIDQNLRRFKVLAT